MKITERVSLSILSKRVRIYVKLLKMTCEHINVILKNDRIEMKLSFKNGEELRVLQYIDKTQRSNFIYRHEHEMVFSWCPGSRLPVDNAVSIMDVTHCKSINQFIIAEISEHDSLELIAKLPKIDEVVVKHIWHPKFLSYEAEYQKERRLIRVLKTVLPVSSAVKMFFPFQNLQNFNYLREILKGNFDAVTLRNYWGRTMPNCDNLFSLNDLRMTNVKSLEFLGPAFEVEDLNRYFKLWMKKKCNDRLEYLEVWINSNTSMDLLLKGLTAVPVPIETMREFRFLGHVKQLFYEETTAEFDITRADGRQATVKIGTWGTVCFYVWPESTNLEQNQSLLNALSYLFSTVVLVQTKAGIYLSLVVVCLLFCYFMKFLE